MDSLSKAKKIEVVIGDLNGSSSSLIAVLESYGYEYLQDDDELLSRLDEEIFECACCNWWCEQSEANESEENHGDICDDCTDS